MSLLLGSVAWFTLFRINEIEPKYYADGEDAYAMKRDLAAFAKSKGIEPADPATFWAPKKEDRRCDDRGGRSAKK